MPALDKAGAGYPTRQAAVWMVTDDASYADLGILVFDGIGGRVIGADDAAQAMMIAEQAGIDVTRKRIWQDRQQVLAKMTTDGPAMTWLEAKGGTLLDALSDSDIQVQIAAASGLGRRQDPLAVEPLLSLLRSTKDDDLRFATAAALAAIKAASVLALSNAIFAAAAISAAVLAAAAVSVASLA